MNHTDSSPAPFWGHTEIEKPWVEVQPFLLARGYQLRPRYRQGWQPSWPEGASIGRIMSAEDYLRMHPGGDILDGVRVSDGKDVVIKRTPSTTTEIAIGLFLSSNELRSDPANHCVPILDTFPDPRGSDYIFVVMPLLRRWHDPPIRTTGEFVDFIDQMLQGLAFMHTHNVTHRDVASSNIMMDGTSMYPDGFHPYAQYRAKNSPKDAKMLTRTQASPKYYFIDFGISSQFRDQDSRLRVVGNLGRTRAPELSLTVPYDPFAVDVFGLGEFLLGEVENFRGIEFLLPLAQAMCQRDPKSRPTADDALHQFRQLRQSLSRNKLSRLLIHRDRGLLVRVGVTVFEAIGLSGLVAIGIAATLAFRFRSSIFRT